MKSLVDEIATVIEQLYKNFYLVRLSALMLLALRLIPKRVRNEAY
jgi:hypothetical protein